MEHGMKFFRIKYIPLGLFYQPKKGRFGGKMSHLGKEGKVYPKNPSLKHIVNSRGEATIMVSDSLIKKHKITNTIEKTWTPRQQFLETKIEDWEIVEYEMVEKSELERLRNLLKCI
jgi:hypothetical protein